MKEKKLENLVEHIKNAPLPNCHGSLESNVLRRIRLAADETTQSLFDWLLGLAPKPQFVLTATALTLVVSFGSTVISTNLHADIAQKEVMASKALGFDVFQGKDFLNLDDQ